MNIRLSKKNENRVRLDAEKQNVTPTVITNQILSVWYLSQDFYTRKAASELCRQIADTLEKKTKT